MIQDDPEYAWNFFDGTIPGEMTISFNNPGVMNLWIEKGRNGHITLVLRDYEKLKAYCIRYVNDPENGVYDGVYIGDVRGLIKLFGGYEDNHDEVFYMYADERDELVRLLKKAISFRDCHMTHEFSMLWTEMVGCVQYLDLINPCQPRYPDAQKTKLRRLSEMDSDGKIVKKGRDLIYDSYKNGMRVRARVTVKSVYAMGCDVKVYGIYQPVISVNSIQIGDLMAVKWNELLIEESS